MFERLGVCFRLVQGPTRQVMAPRVEGGGAAHALGRLDGLGRPTQFHLDRGQVHEHVQVGRELLGQGLKAGEGFFLPVQVRLNEGPVDSQGAVVRPAREAPLERFACLVEFSLDGQKHAEFVLQFVGASREGHRPPQFFFGLVEPAFAREEGGEISVEVVAVRLFGQRAAKYAACPADVGFGGGQARQLRQDHRVRRAQFQRPHQVPAGPPRGEAAGLGRLVRPEERRPQFLVDPRVVRRLLQEFFVQGDGALEVPGVHEVSAHRQPRFARVRIQLQFALQFPACPLEVALLRQGPRDGQVEVRKLGVPLRRSLPDGDGLVRPPLRRQHQTPLVGRFRARRVRVQRLLEGPLGFVEPAEVPVRPDELCEHRFVIRRQPARPLQVSQRFAVVRPEP